MQIPIIPTIDDPELIAAVSALTRAACVMRSLFFIAGDGNPDIKELLEKHDEIATLADSVINRWRQHLGIAEEDILIN
jgi:hypothetical protein